MTQEQPHTQAQARRTLVHLFGRQVLHLPAACLTFFFGASVVPWLLADGSWVIHRIPWWQTRASFPHLTPFLAAPHALPGLLWLFYYVVSAVAVSIPPDPETLHEVSAQVRQTRREDSMHLITGRVIESRARPKRPSPLSHAWPGEQKQVLVECCYQEYREALQRYDPPPLTLRTPPSFSYRKGGELTWDKTTQEPIIPEAFLEPERIHELLPLLAHHLASYNAGITGSVPARGTPALSRAQLALFVLTGNFLWIPLAANSVGDGPDRAPASAAQGKPVHEADRFAVYLGQGPALEHTLRRMRADLKRRGEEDVSVPTLSERIGHLEALNAQEREQMRALGLTPKEPLLVKGTTTKRLTSGTKRTTW